MQLCSILFVALSAASTGPSSVQETQQGEEDPRGQVDWFAGSYAEALAEAGAQDKLLLVEFWADWCSWCREHERTNLVDEQVLAALGSFVCYGANLSQDADGDIVDKSAEKLMNRFGVRRFPGLVFVRPGDRPEDLISGYLPQPRLLAELARVESGRGTISALEGLIEKAPADLELKYQYALKLDDLGDFAGYQAQIDLIVALDPEAASLPRRRMTLGIMREQLWGCMRDPEQAPDPTELRAFLASEEHAEILCNGWLLMGVVENELQNLEASREAYRTAWKYVPGYQVASVGNGIAWGYWTQRDELGPNDKRWALQVSLEATAAFEAQSTDPVSIAQYLDTLACCYYMNGKRAKALELMKRCIELAPDDPIYTDRYDQFKSRG